MGVDEMGVDEMGVDKMRVDEIGVVKMGTYGLSHSQLRSLLLCWSSCVFLFLYTLTHT